ncbi:HD domain-containing protein [Methermicoccus shengliensis]|uniref:HD domain-containing protein n=1 Tax=Methermicoccus shengliensis TaxID=660064 RepID=A0A832RX42_9EURY|nr:HD domain-containing protein [Methermicoccus shengliensis]KUK04088.1 MAG: Metal dependent phosphohydrolase [Euryarchaeota archaeon 55_53]KUK29854.1 MAG: Metal dependent phosphohydrolase [Methanosarcinales archeaon 56_1174]MDI3488345.1 uncharacterized protein [Methanosarcinales archaeon]MDN5294806.1 uncharacterized protein [Methanosarcinales archaeon]HIH69818.1 HD domain-containing protein [Methermicoccus shengliensis]
MRIIRDAVHGHIHVENDALRLLDTPQMQRLRRVAQLGFCSLVYPGANHTRFEHSLGTYHLASVLCSLMGASIPQDELRTFRLAALLHDVGHPPMSHTTERVLCTFDGLIHTNIEHIMRATELEEMLGEVGLSLGEVGRLARGNTELGRLLSSEIDVDRMDYLVRDAHYTGVAYGLVDVQHLLHQLTLKGGKAVLLEGGVHAAESLLVSRFLMYPTVYLHHVSRIAECMLGAGIESLLSSGCAKPSAIRMMDDWELFQLLASSEDELASEMVARIKGRRLYKRAVYVGMDAIECSLELLGRKDRLATQIAQEAGVEKHEVLVDIPPMPEMEEMKTLVECGGELKRLEQVSEVVRVLGAAHAKSWRLGVFCPEEHVERVARAARSILGISQTSQCTLDMEAGHEKNA